MKITNNLDMPVNHLFVFYEPTLQKLHKMIQDESLSDLHFLV